MTDLPPPYNAIKHINNAQLQALLDAGNTVVLDVRTPMEWQALGAIPGATLLPIQELMARLGELDKSAPTAVICEHGVRSWDAAFYLAQQGFATVYNHTEGMHAWDGPRETPAQ